MSLFARAQLPPLTISGGTGVCLLRQAAGQLVTPDTAKQKVAYGASVDLIAGLVSTLPVTVRRKRNGVMVPVESPAVLLDPEGLGHGLEDFTYMWTAQLLTRGNNFCYPGTLDAQARPSVVRLLDPNRLSLVASDAGYDVRLPGGETKPLYGPAHLDGVKHSRAYAVPGQVRRLAGLPPTLVMTGDDDPLRDEAARYTERLAAGGIPARFELLHTATGWPESLTEAGPQDECRCGVLVRPHLAAFLYPATPPPASG